MDGNRAGKGGFKRLLRTIAFAICFGFVAGGVMFGVNWATGELIEGNGKEETKEIASTNTASDAVSAEVANSTPEGNKGVGNVAVTDVSSVVEEVMPSIVAITSTQVVDPGYSFWFSDEGYEKKGAGSGIIVGKSSSELLIVTNNHVVADSDSLSVQFINETSVDAYVKGTSPNNDLAVVSIPLDTIDDETVNAIKVATLGDSDELKIGAGTIAIGNALGYGQSVTTGVVSALNREISVEGKTLTLLQTDTAINPGNSGGALLNVRGEVIGINTAKSYDSSSGIEGVGFAIPISSAKEIINDLMNKETKMKVDEEERGYLGINGTDVSTQTFEVYGIPQGVYVYSTVEGGPADKAGIEKGCVITGLDGEEITSLSQLVESLEYYKVGDKVTLTVQMPKGNDYEEKKAEVTLGEKQEETTRNKR